MDINAAKNDNPLANDSQHCSGIEREVTASREALSVLAPRTKQNKHGRVESTIFPGRVIKHGSVCSSTSDTVAACIAGVVVCVHVRACTSYVFVFSLFMFTIPRRGEMLCGRHSHGDEHH